MLIGLALISGCVREAPPEYERLLNLPSEVLKDTVHTLPARKQVALYYYGNTSRHPPMTEIRWLLARQGETLIPELLLALDTTSYAFFKLDLVQVFDSMACTYDIRLPEDEVRRIERAVARMPAGDWASRAREYVASIQDCNTLPLGEDVRE